MCTKSYISSIISCFLLLIACHLFSDTAELSLGAGIHLDIAPYGVEQIYMSINSSYTPQHLSFLMARVSILFNRDAVLARFPLCVICPAARLAEDRRFAVWMGGGIEIYRSHEYSTFSPLISSGGRFLFRNVVIDLPIESAFRIRRKNIDSDIGFIVGYRFN